MLSNLTTLGAKTQILSERHKLLFLSLDKFSGNLQPIIYFEWSQVDFIKNHNIVYQKKIIILGLGR